eukprot:592871-Rhodomonas_salina.1
MTTQVRSAMRLCARYAMSGTDVRPWLYPPMATVLTYAHDCTRLCARYAMSGTDVRVLGYQSIASKTRSSTLASAHPRSVYYHTTRTHNKKK